MPDIKWIGAIQMSQDSSPIRFQNCWFIGIDRCQLVNTREDGSLDVVEMSREEYERHPLKFRQDPPQE